jgi:hypothetical protein
MVPAKIFEHLPPSLPEETTGKIEMWTVDRGNPLAVTPRVTVAFAVQTAK